MGKNNVFIDKPGSKLSDLDDGAIFRDIHSYPDHSIRVRDTVSVVKEYFDNFTVTYNVNNLPTQACYYVGLEPHLTTIGTRSDVGGDLNNTYFFIYEARSNKLFHVWYNVDSLGVNPAPANSTGIEIQINSNDNSALVAYATELVLSLYSTYFNVSRTNSVLKITTVKLGEANNTLDVSTSFLITNDPGEKELIKKIDISYVGNNPKWEGQELKGYSFNVFTGKFEKNLDVDISAETGDTIAISGHSTYRNIVSETNKLDTELSISAYTEISTYTATENLKIRAIKIKADTFGAFKLKINGVVRDYFQSSPFERNALFEFWEDELLNNTQVISVEFLPDRIQLDDYNFFIRIEAYAI